VALLHPAARRAGRPHADRKLRLQGATLPELVGSIGVLRKCGFRHIGEGSEPGVIRYELTRDEYLAGRTGS
jgi:RimJ/RimL family protein N-acetyltransferase